MLEDGQCRSFIHRFGGAGGFHLHAVVAVTEDIFREQHNDGHNTPPSTSTSASSSCIHCCKHSSRKGWIMAIGSLCLITTQILSLNWMILEMTLPRCSMHTDCNIGQYCEQKLDKRPRCWDCKYVEEKPDVLRKCKSNYEYYKNIRDDITVWVSKNNIWHPKSLMNYTAVACLKYLYCLQTDIGNEDDYRINDDFYVSNDAMGAETEMWPHKELWPYKDEKYNEISYPSCDYSKMNASKLTWTNVVVLLFITLIFTVVIWADIEECIAEEALLDYKIKVASQQERFIHPFSPVHTLRFALRMRKFGLPWVICIATALIIVTESITAKKIY